MIRQIEHTAIIVTDMDRSIAFYRSLGFEVRLRGTNPAREMTFLYLPQHPGVEIELIRELNPDTTFSEDGIVNHLAFRVDHIEETIAALKEQGVEFVSDEPKPTLDGGKMVLFYGPDRELLQLIQVPKERQQV